MQKSLRFIVCFAALLLASFAMQAQAPQKFSYQAVVRNASNELIRNNTVGVRISIYQTAPLSGVLKFQETHTPTTNDNGLFTIEIGNGSNQSGSIASIDWGDGPYFLRCEVDPAGGTSYTLTADQQLLAVPYALHCNEYQDLADIVAKGNHAGMKQLKDVKDPTQAQDAVTKHYLDSVVAIVSALAGARVKDTAASACVSFTWPRTGLTYNTSGIYFDTIKNACGAGCDTVVAMRLTIVDGPAVTLGEITSNVGTSSCAGAEAALTAHVTASNGTLSYLWTKDAGAALQSNNTVAVATEALTAGSNSYTVTVTASVDGCGTADASKNITITASAASAVALNDINSSNGATICIGASTGLSVSPSSNTGTVSYVWSVSPATGGLSATSGDAVTATPTATGSHTYTVVATAHQDGCVDATDTKSIPISVVAQPAVSLGNLTSTNGNTFCVGNTSTTLSLGAGTSEGTVAYAWSATNSATAGLTDDNETSRTVEPTAANTYVYTVTATASKAYGGCDNAVDSKSYTVTVNAAPELVLGNIKSNGTAATVDGLNTTSHTLTAVINTPDPLPGSGISYQWYKNSSTMAGETNATLDITTAGVYKVRVTYNNGTCSTYQEKEITICGTPDVPAIELTAGSATMCAGNSATLRVTDGTYNGAYTYTWKKGGVATGTTGQTYNIASATAGDAGSYTVTAQNTTAGCTAYDQTSSAQAITVNAPAVTLYGINASYKEGGASKSPTHLNGNTITADKDQTCTLSASTSGTSGTVLYEWSTSSSFTSTVSTSSSYSAPTSTTGSTTYYLRTRAYTGSCTTAYSATKSVTVTVAEACNVSISSLSWTRQGQGLPNAPIVLKPTFSASGYTSLSWSWSRYNGSGSGATGGQTPSYIIENTQNSKNAFILSNNATTLYWGVTLTASNATCSVSKTYISSVVMTSNYTSSGSFTLNAFKSGTKGLSITASGSVGSNSYLCVSVVPLSNTECVDNTNPCYFKSSSTSKTSWSASYTFDTAPKSGTNVRVYGWLSSSGSCTMGSYGKSALTYTTVSY